MSSKAIFIDRDGTLNEDVGYISDPKEFRLFDFAPEAVRLINNSGFLVIVLTNQSGIARGFLTEEILGRLHDKMESELASRGARIDRIYFCPHHPEIGEPPYKVDCDCRKPKSGLILQAATEMDVNLKKSYVVGDRYRDMEMGQAVGATGVLVLTGFGREEALTPPANRLQQPEHVAENLVEAVRWILNRENIDISR